jgi:hypothetical protein
MGEGISFMPQNKLLANQIKKAPGIYLYFKFLYKSLNR